jgi:hypothetical protein
MLSDKQNIQNQYPLFQILDVADLLLLLFLAVDIHACQVAGHLGFARLTLLPSI